MADPKRGILIDTDLGVDDTIALLMALAHPEVEILAITTTHGNIGVEHVSRNVRQVLEYTRREIPVYPGSAVPLYGDALTPSLLMGTDGLGGASMQLPAPLMSLQTTPAGLALVQQIHAAAKRGDFCLVMLGPLTNLALALALDPQIPRLVPHLVIMGGAVDGRGNQTAAAEFNFYADPEAAGVVFRAGFPHLTLLPWETSTKYLLNWESYEQLTKIESRPAQLFTQVTASMVDFLKHQFHLPGTPLPDPLLPQGRAQGSAGIVGDQAGADQGVGVDVAMAEGMAAVAENLDRLAGIEALERRRLGIDLVAVDPAVAGEQAAILVFVEAQGGCAGHVVYFSAMAFPG